MRLQRAPAPAAELAELKSLALSKMRVLINAMADLPQMEIKCGFNHHLAYLA